MPSYVLEGNAALCRYARTLSGDHATTYAEAIADAKRTAECLHIEVRVAQDRVPVAWFTSWISEPRKGETRGDSGEWLAPPL